MDNIINDDEHASQGKSLNELLQLQTIYSLTTLINSTCFSSCICPQSHNTNLNPSKVFMSKFEEKDKACVTNCAINFIQMKLYFNKRMFEAIQEQKLN